MPRRLPQKTRSAAGNSARKGVTKSPAIAAMARRHADAALSALIEVVGDRTASAAARISAASTLLNWGFGKSSVAGDESDNSPTELVIRWRNVQEGQEAEGTQDPRAGRTAKAKRTS